MTVGLLVLLPMLAGCSTGMPRDLDSTAAAPPVDSTSTAESTAEPTTEPSSSGSSSATETGETADPTPTPTDAGDGGGAGDDGSEPPPAESEAQTLCNLTHEYVLALYVNGTADDGAYLEVAALSLSDSLRIWRGLVADYPDAKADVERAQTVHDLWQEATSVLAEGDVNQYEDLLAESENEIDQLPSTASATEVECT